MQLSELRDQLQKRDNPKAIRYIRIALLCFVLGVWITACGLFGRINAKAAEAPGAPELEYFGQIYQNTPGSASYLYAIPGSVFLVYDRLVFCFLDGVQVPFRVESPSVEHPVVYDFWYTILYDYNPASTGFSLLLIDGAVAFKGDPVSGSTHINGDGFDRVWADDSWTYKVWYKELLSGDDFPSLDNLITGDVTEWPEIGAPSPSPEPSASPSPSPTSVPEMVLAFEATFGTAYSSPYDGKHYVYMYPGSSLELLTIIGSSLDRDYISAYGSYGSTGLYFDGGPSSLLSFPVQRSTSTTFYVPVTVDLAHVYSLPELQYSAGVYEFVVGSNTYRGPSFSFVNAALDPTPTPIDTGVSIPQVTLPPGLNGVNSDFNTVGDWLGSMDFGFLSVFAVLPYQVRVFLITLLGLFVGLAVYRLFMR